MKKKKIKLVFGNDIPPLSLAGKLQLVFALYNTRYKGRRLMTKKEALKLLDGALDAKRP